MELSINDKQTKELLTEIMLELLKTKRDMLLDIVLEVIEDIGLARAIAEGKSCECVTEDEILYIIDGALSAN